MPIFEFSCPECGYVFELLTNHCLDETVCLRCGFIADKVLSAPNFVVNGYNAKNLYARKDTDE